MNKQLERARTSYASKVACWKPRTLSSRQVARHRPTTIVRVPTNWVAGSGSRVAGHRRHRVQEEEVEQSWVG
jgi:hypothetical protein